MSSATPTKIRNLAELLDRLGGIPLDRVRLHPAPGTATRQDVIDADRMGGPPCELIDGVLVDKGMGFKESLIAATIIGLLSEFVRARDLGVIVGADGTVELWEGLVRIPDAAFVSWSRLPGGVPSEPIPELAPDLAVEVLSRTNTRREMERKRSDFFQAGTRLIWTIDPQQRTIQVHTSPEEFIELRIDDTLDGGEVLPGFVVPVKDVFAELDRANEQ